MHLQWLFLAFGKYMSLPLSIRYALVCHMLGFVITINKLNVICYYLLKSLVFNLSQYLYLIFSSPFHFWLWFSFTLTSLFTTTE